MSHNIKPLTDFLRQLGTAEVEHTHGSFLAHLVGVYRDLEKWGCDEDVCNAGLFHSIYGTQQFQSFKLDVDRRSKLQELIGQRAEWLAFLNCFMQRETFDAALEQSAGPYRIRNRETDEEYEVAPDDFEDLCRVHLCDWLEQVPRSQKWDYRRDAYQRMAERLGGIAQESYERVFGEHASQ